MIKKFADIVHEWSLHLTYTGKRSVNEDELAEEISALIVKYGGQEGAAMLKAQATEQLEMMDDNRVIDSTVERLNMMIQQFENMGATDGGKTKQSYKEKMILNAAIREVFLHRFAVMFHSFEHFVIVTEEQDLNMTPQSDTPQNFDKILKYRCHPWFVKLKNCLEPFETNSKLFY